MKNNRVVVISAPSGTGKSSIVSVVIKENRQCSFSISTTTRIARPGEIEGKDYYFVSREIFEGLIHESAFVEWAEVHGNYYGTSRNEIDRINQENKIAILDIDVQGAESVKRIIPDAVLILVVPPDCRELSRRLVSRGTNSAEEIKLRMNNARTELRRFGMFDYIVRNEVLTEAISDVTAIIRTCFLERRFQEATMQQLLENCDDYTNG